jgi:hypothetical protein
MKGIEGKCEGKKIVFVDTAEVSILKKKRSGVI